MQKNYQNILIIMSPVIPHLANECLDKLKCKDRNEWPVIDEQLISKQKIKLVIQINGKTRSVIDIDKGKK